MGVVEIFAISISVLVVFGVLGKYVYRKIKHLPTGECAMCAKDNRKKGNRLLKEYHKMYSCPNCKNK